MIQHELPNKLIADFMELEYWLSPYDNKYWWRTLPDEGGLCRVQKELLYQCSWDALIPVVKRCNDIYMTLDRLKLKPGEHKYYVELQFIAEYLQQSLFTFDITIIYKIVLKFIQAYNEHKHKEWVTKL